MAGYTYDNSHVLKNKLGFTDEDRLKAAEAERVNRRMFELEMVDGPTGTFSTAHLKAIHHHLFQDVYEWAGHTRDERFVLPDGETATMPSMRKDDGAAFATGPEIDLGLKSVEADLKSANYLRGLPREEFAERAADLMCELNGIHPFREGNGRTQRTFLRELAKQAGHDLDFSVISQERMTHASILAHENADPSMMRRMFDEISDPARTALLRNSIAALEKLEFPWNQRYVATVAPGHTVDLVLAGIAGDQFMARTGSQILFGENSLLPEPRPERGQKFTLTVPGRSHEIAKPSNAERASRAPELGKDHKPGRGGRGGR